MKTVVKDCKWGRFMLLRGDMVSQYADLYGEWCEHEVSLYQKLLAPESNVVEVGAHIGLHTVPLSRIASKGRVICFEPQRILHQVLCGNCALNGCTNVVAVHGAAGKLSGTVELRATDYETPWNYSAFSLGRGFDAEDKFSGASWTERVTVWKLDDGTTIRQLDSLALLKIDVEGMEADVLLGARETIARYRPAIFVENNNEENSAGLLAVLRELGYACYWFCSERYRPDNYNRVGWQIPGTDFNMLCLPDEQKRDSFGLMKVGSFADLKAGRVPLVTA